MKILRYIHQNNQLKSNMKNFQACISKERKPLLLQFGLSQADIHQCQHSKFNNLPIAGTIKGLYDDEDYTAFA